MTALEKFLADIKRIIKHDRADNGGHYDGKRACTQIASLFERNNPNLGPLASSISQYWLNTYIFSSEDILNEPSEENVARLSAFQSFVDNADGDDLDILTADDFENLKNFIDDAQEEIDLDTLQNMMGILLSKGAI